ncbi:MAG: flagellar hook-associated protein 3 [Calditrichaeota bacterium]|nr:flagellar hook-associated protein 3 [Calditrichota bacterium]
MRVTQNYSINSLLRQVNYTRERINIYQRNLATGKRINQISDDPEKIETVIRYRRMLTLNQRFEQNIDNALDFMYFTSQVLDDSANVIARLKELAIQGVDSIGDDEWNAFVKQYDEMLDKLVQLANSKFKDRYLFGGVNVNKAPFILSPDRSRVDTNPDGVSGALKVELGNGKVDAYNVSGQEAFLSPVNVFDVVIQVRDAFKNQDAQEINRLIPQLDAALDQILQENAKLGAKINRFQLLRQQYDSEDLRIQEFLSKIEDTDLAQTVVDLQMEQTALETALRALAQTVNISLVDFIR